MYREHKRKTIGDYDCSEAQGKDQGLAGEVVSAGTKGPRTKDPYQETPNSPVVNTEPLKVSKQEHHSLGDQLEIGLPLCGNGLCWVWRWKGPKGDIQKSCNGG